MLFFPDGAHLVSYRDVCILCVRATLHSADEKNVLFGHVEGRFNL